MLLLTPTLRRRHDPGVPKQPVNLEECMKHGVLRYGLAVLVVGLLGVQVASTQSPPPARAGSLARQLVGTWRLLSWEDRAKPEGPWTHRYGEHPFGLFIYTADGHVAIQVMRNGPPDPTAPAATGLAGPFHAYYGTFIVDEAKMIVHHLVVASDSPSQVNTDQPREFQVMGDRLILGDEKVRRRVLERLKPKDDLK